MIEKLQPNTNDNGNDNDDDDDDGGILAPLRRAMKSILAWFKKLLSFFSSK